MANLALVPAEAGQPKHADAARVFIASDIPSSWVRARAALRPGVADLFRGVADAMDALTAVPRQVPRGGMS